MMQVLEMLAFKADMRKIMLTVLKHNESATKFFKSHMKFEIDETNPAEDVQWNEKYNDIEQIDYEILSKFNKRKFFSRFQSKLVTYFYRQILPIDRVAVKKKTISLYQNST